MDGDGCDDGWSFDEQAFFDFERECELPTRRSRPRTVAMATRMEVERVRVAYDEVRATPRVVFRATKRRRIDGPSCRTEIALPSLGLGPLSIAFSFLHPVELVRMEMTAKAVREPVDDAWRRMFKRLVHVRRPGRQRWELSSLVPRKIEECGIADCRRAVLLEEGELCFCGDWKLVLEPKKIEEPWIAGYSLQRCSPGSLSDLLQKRYIFVRGQCKDETFPSACECREVNQQWFQLFPDRPLRCRRCKEFDLALDCMDLAMVYIGAEMEDDRDEALWIDEWEKKHRGVG